MSKKFLHCLLPWSYKGKQAAVQYGYKHPFDQKHQAGWFISAWRAKASVPIKAENTVAYME